MARQPSGFVFKGGTCLRRCYIPGYRYSEDLDFTATPEAASLDLVAAVGVWCAWLGQEAGIRAQAEGDASPRRAWVSFTGPLGALRQRSIKVDIPDDEAIVDRITDRQLISEYSDLDGSGFLVPCYSLAEIWAEKTRSLMQRSEPRDLYDLHELDRLDGGLAVAGRGLFREKARSKGLVPACSARSSTSARRASGVGGTSALAIRWERFRSSRKQSGGFGAPYATRTISRSGGRSPQLAAYETYARSVRAMSSRGVCVPSAGRRPRLPTRTSRVRIPSPAPMPSSDPWAARRVRATTHTTPRGRSPIDRSTDRPIDRSTGRSLGATVRPSAAGERQQAIGEIERCSECALGGDPR